MMLPIVARRSPAITTPSAQVNATIVVPWDSSGGAVAPPGSRCGSAVARNSVNDPVPGRRYAAGTAETGQ